METHPARKLAVILHADVVGSTDLVQRDERLAHARIQDTFQRFSKTIESYGGIAHEIRGDALLAACDRATDAVSAALAFQASNAECNDALDDEIRPEVRVGISLGEVVIADGTLTGPDVVLAQRLEQLAHPGGVCISVEVQHALPKRLPFEYSDQGDLKLKGFDEPVRAYGVTLQSGSQIPESEPRVQSEQPADSARRRFAAVGIIAVAAIAAGIAISWRPWVPATEPSDPTKLAAPLPDKPSIAVLPFTNMSSDVEQEYFSDGMTEDLITDLSKLSNLTVISRTSTSGYKGREVDVREVGEALNVRYVIEGSARKVGSRVRINAQLIDVTTGGHVWAERYDGDLKDIFSLQDKVLEKIVGALALTLSEEERRRLAARGTDSVVAHDLYLKGLFEESKFTREASREAVRLYEQALSIAPNYPLPYARLSNIFQLNPRNGWSDNVEADLEKAVELAEKAVSLDGQNPNLYWMLGRALARIQTAGALTRGIQAMQRAIELDPNFADAYAFLGDIYMGDGRASDGLRALETAMRLNPRYPFWYLFMRGTNHYMLEDYESAIADFEAAAERSPTAHFVRWWLAASYAQAGRQDDAEWQVDELMSLGFDGSIETITATGTIHHPAYMKLYKEGLRKAGMPD